MSWLSTFFRLLPPLGSGFFGLTMSPDGGLEEVEEPLRAAASGGVFVLSRLNS
jgi:hypothetical protein